MGFVSSRRFWLGLGGALVALAVTVLVQSLLLAANYTASAAEAYGIVVGFAVAMPLLQSVARPVVGASATVRLRLAAATAIGSLLAGFVVVSTLRSLDISGSVTVASGAAGAYVGGTAVRSFLVTEEEETEPDEIAGDDARTGPGSAAADSE